MGFYNGLNEDLSSFGTHTLVQVLLYLQTSVKWLNSVVGVWYV